MTDIESPEAFAERLSELADLKYIGGGEYLAEFDCSRAAAFISARDEAIRADERAKVEAERWIPVGERLPDPLEVVLIYPFNVDDPLVGYRQFDNWWGDNDEHEPKPIFHVTHWRALPEGPK